MHKKPKAKYYLLRTGIGRVKRFGPYTSKASRRLARTRLEMHFHSQDPCLHDLDVNNNVPRFFLP